ncbi:DUF3488 domain-containing protein [Sulfurimonas sp. MAG313]|nr:DUF3488 and transglutaminase-like domain-containing protein [Sulfurimonas sp. MAG313]MDF1881247.1 DUF3488 domain-containing protein [Sulfurimonas sp. MAG313]
MKFLNFLPSTKLSQLQLLDIAISLAFLPLLFLLKLPMLIFLGLSLIFILQKRSSKLVLFSFSLLGLVALGISFISEYNFSSVSKLLVFISILISILSYAVVLQRLTRQINIYLSLSPAMLMILSFFFYNSIEMLFYALFTLFTFTFLLLYHKMTSSFINVLRINSLLYLFALPIVVFLFLVFPRISYKDASFGFRGEDISRTGHDGTMFIDAKSLLIPSSKLVMEVSFKKGIPSGKFLYFRGSTLYIDMGKEWIGVPRKKVYSPAISNVKNIIDYNIKLYPHNQHWLYMLDLPLIIPSKSSLDSDYITLSQKPLYQSYQYNARSALSFSTRKESQKSLEKSLKVDKNRDPRVYKRLLRTINIQNKDSIKAQKLLIFFSDLNLSYSLRPEPIDLNHPLDSFLLDSKTGYCVHFASSFATSARLLGIPSRIVTGYKADPSNALNNYLLVRQADAHAWVELYFKDKGWVRFEPTSTAARIIAPDNAGLSNSYTSEAFKNSFLIQSIKQLNIYYLYTRHIITTWILQYDRNKQTAILKKLLTNTIYLLKFIASISVLILISFSLFILFQKRRQDDLYLREMQTLLKALKKRSFVRLQGETMSHFLLRVQEKGYKEIKEISDVYHQGRYSKKSNNYLAQLRAKIKTFKKSL